MTTLYRSIRETKCKLDLKILEQSIILAALAPDEFAASIMKKPGYLAYVAAEVLYIFPCLPVKVSIFNTDKCYTELSINHTGIKKFMTLRTKIIKDHGQEIPCRLLAPQTFYIDGKWVEMAPNARWSEPPQVLTPQREFSWK